jgi:hypothetical protein
VFRALTSKLRQVDWTDKFKPKLIDKYDGSNKPKDLIEIYHTIIKVVGGDDWVKGNYLSTALSGATRLWLINLPEGIIYN